MDAATLYTRSPALAERHPLGVDRFDEAWEGVLHVVPSPSNEHQRMEFELAVALRGVARCAGLEIRLEMGLFPPEAPGHFDYRQPDVVLYGPECHSELGVDGPAAIAYGFKNGVAVRVVPVP